MGLPSFSWRAFFAISAGVLLVEVAAYLIILHFIGNLTDRGQFGDSFGAVNSVFSGLAFVGLISTLLLQRDQISDQQNQYLIIRDEVAVSLDGQKRANHLQALTLLMGYYDERILRMAEYSDGPQGAAVAKLKAEMVSKREELEVVIGSIHADVISNFGGDCVR